MGEITIPAALKSEGIDEDKIRLLLDSVPRKSIAAIASDCGISYRNRMGKVTYAGGRLHNWLAQLRWLKQVELGIFQVRGEDE